MQTDSNICVVCFVKMHFLCFDIFVIREFPLYFWCICLNGVPRKEEENDGNTLQRRKRTLHKKKRNAVIFFKDLKVDVPLAGGPLDKNPTLRRAGLVEIWSRMILAPGKSALARLDFAAKRIILSDSLLFCCIFWTLLQRGSHWVTHYRSAASSGLCCKGDHTEWLTVVLLHFLDFAAKGITLSDSLSVCCIFWTLLQRGSHWVTHYQSAASSGLCCKGDHTEWLTIGLLHLLDFAAKGITLSDSLSVCCIFWTLLQRGSHWVTHYWSAASSGLWGKGDHIEWWMSLQLTTTWLSTPFGSKP